MKLFEKESNDFSSQLWRTNHIETIHHKSWKAFLARWDGPEWYNQVLRWNMSHWLNGRNKIEILFFQPRQGLIFYITVSVKKEDEAAILEYLQEQWRYMQNLWKPVSGETK